MGDGPQKISSVGNHENWAFCLREGRGYWGAMGGGGVPGVGEEAGDTRRYSPIWRYGSRTVTFRTVTLRTVTIRIVTLGIYQTDCYPQDSYPQEYLLLFYDFVLIFVLVSTRDISPFALNFEINVTVLGVR